MKEKMEKPGVDNHRRGDVDAALWSAPSFSCSQTPNFVHKKKYHIKNMCVRARYARATDRTIDRTIKKETFGRNEQARLTNAPKLPREFGSTG